MPTRLKRRLLRVRDRIVEVIRESWSLVCGAAVRLVRAPRTPSSRARPRILVVDEMLPDSRFGAGYPRAAQLLHAIVDAGWDTTMYPMIAAPADYGAMRRRFPAVRFLASQGEGGLRRFMRQSVGEFDVVLVSRSPVMAAFSRACRRLPSFLEDTFCIYDAEAVFAVRDARRLELFAVAMTTGEYQRALAGEMALVDLAPAVMTVTEAEARLFRAHTCTRVHVVGHSIAATAAVATFEQRSDLLFVGRSEGAREFSPNVDSLIWFVEEVMPLLDARIGAQYRLVIAGIADARLVERLGSDRVRFEGVVDDLSLLYRRSRVFVAPTRYAAGIPLKVIEAAAAGIPCVVTSLLATQLGFDDDVELLAAHDAADFAAACARLYQDATLWNRLRDAALARIADAYSPPVFDQAVRRALQDSLVWLHEARARR